MKKAELTLGFVLYRWDTTEYPDGSHNITVYAEDHVGNSDQLEIQVFVSNSLPIIIPLLAAGVITLIAIVLVMKRNVLFKGRMNISFCMLNGFKNRR